LKTPRRHFTLSGIAEDPARTEKEIRPCGCGDEDCPVWLLSDNACLKMDAMRKKVFQKFEAIYPDFKLQLSR